MKAVNYSEFRQNLKNYLDSSYEDHEPIIVTRKRNENVVVLSQEDYDSMKETIYLLSSRTNANRLYDSIQQYEEGKKTSFDISELKDKI